MELWLKEFGKFGLAILASIIAGFIVQIITKYWLETNEVIIPSPLQASIIVNRPSGYIDIWLFGLSAVIMMAIPMIWACMDIPWTIRLSALSLSAIVFVISPFIAREILSTKVNPVQSITGRVLNPYGHYRVLVHPVRVPDCWVQRTILPDQTGNWETACFFGGSSRERFEIIAVASRDQFPWREGAVVPCDRLLQYPDRYIRRVTKR